MVVSKPKLTKKEILKLRTSLIKYLSTYKDKEVINLSNYGLTPNILEQIIFKKVINKRKEKYKEFAFDENLIKLIDLTKVSFDGFNFQSKSELVHDFTGYTGIEINPQKIYKKNFQNCIFENIKYIGSFDNCDIRYATFKNCEDVKINPQTIRYKDFCFTKLEGVEFIDSFDGCNFNYTTIKNCKNAIIDPQTIKRKLMCWAFNNCSFEDIIIINHFQNMNIYNLSLNNCIFEGKSSVPDIFKKSILKKVKIENCQDFILNPTVIRLLIDSSINDAKLFIPSSKSYRDNNIESIINGLTYEEYQNQTFRLKLKNNH